MQSNRKRRRPSPRRSPDRNRTVLLNGQPPAAVLIPVAALGLVAGSFVTALTYRWPRGESIAHGRSKCASCGHVLAARDLVPLFSWLVNRGACRYCGARISHRYPAIEATMLLLFMAAAMLATDPIKLALSLLMTATMVALAVIDLEHRRLPNGFIAFLAVLALAWRWEVDGKLLIGAITAVGIAAVCLLINAGLGAISPRATLGMGDAKLLAVGGLALAPGLTLLFVGLAGVIGVVFALMRTKQRSEPFPFGPAILLSLWLIVIAGDRFLTGSGLALT